jgi:predicted metal-dependent phosphoesterase TrpH
MIDLHTHSNASDGVLSPTELVQYAAKQGVTVLALTDHDTTAGISEAAIAAKQSEIRFIPGIELNIEWKGGEFHLLGLGITNPAALAGIVQNSQSKREQRNLVIIQKMRSDGGIFVTLEELQEISHTSSIGRPHFADFLVSKKLAKSRSAAFDKFLSEGRPFYAERSGENLDNAIKAIVDSGALPVIAHPKSLHVSWGKIEGLLSDFRLKGIAGIEAWHPSARERDCERFENIAKKLGYFVTAGSDFHCEPERGLSFASASGKHTTKIGHTTGGIPIDEKFLPEELQKYLKCASATLPFGSMYSDQ